jgi:prepilin-type N-terminal cleavage/methylation domain-containing protein
MNAPQAEPRRNKPFTLIELLVVIAIIAVLMGLLFPAISLVKQNAKVTKAKSEMSAIIMAIKNYESTYGILPGSDAALAGYDPWVNDPDHGDYNDNYDILMQILTKVDMTSGGAQNESDAGNARKVVFLDAPSDFAAKGYVDPWGSRYVVLMDVITDGGSDDPYDNKITVKQDVSTKQKGFSDGSTLNGSVFVYCWGNDAAAGGSDDIVSWE